MIVLLLLGQLLLNSPEVRTEQHHRAEIQNKGIMARIKNGLQLAGELLGLDPIARLLTATLPFSTPKSIFSGIFRVLGLNSTKLKAIAINGLIFIAQMITNSLATHSSVPPLKNENLSPIEDTPLYWFLQEPTQEMSNLMARAQDSTLSEQLITGIDQDHACVKLLICKITPFIQGMQNAIHTILNNKLDNHWQKLTPIEKMYHFLPSLKNVTDFGDECDQRFASACKLDHLL